MEHINVRVGAAYPPDKSATESGAIPDTIRSQAMESRDMEPFALRNKEVNDVLESIRPSIAVARNKLRKAHQN
eukprot:8566968-Karenia_brevis.AAC.1